ncbi:hypothetical protein I317_01841 [Kwoniella heveanensis CBS 569]|nr:hypothetical protein I317_01841 [Kwoniella heveanensis CBS 569]
MSGQSASELSRVSVLGHRHAREQHALCQEGISRRSSTMRRSTASQPSASPSNANQTTADNQAEAHTPSGTHTQGQADASVGAFNTAGASTNEPWAWLKEDWSLL